jgi:hypothetical protein
MLLWAHFGEFKNHAGDVSICVYSDSEDWVFQIPAWACAFKGTSVPGPSENTAQANEQEAG